MQPHQQRVVAERDELEGKLFRLEQFIVGDLFKGLPSDEQARLSRQRLLMYQYLEVLNERIAAF